MIKGPLLSTTLYSFSFINRCFFYNFVFPLYYYYIYLKFITVSECRKNKHCIEFKCSNRVNFKSV